MIVAVVEINTRADDRDPHKEMRNKRRTITIVIIYIYVRAEVGRMRVRDLRENEQAPPSPLPFLHI